MAYAKQTWENEPATTTPTSAERFNYMEAGIAAAAATADTAKQTADNNSYTLSQADNRYALKSEIPPDWPVFADTTAANAAIADGTLVDGDKLIILA